MVTTKSGITSQEILSRIGNSTGYEVKRITLKDPSFGNVTGAVPNLKIELAKYGNFTADMFLSKTGHLDATIKGAPFERIIEILPAPDDLSFTALQKAYASGGSFTANEILRQIRGTKDGYTVKAIQSLSTTSVARIAPDKKSIEFIKAGNFTATIILEHLARYEARITNAQFEIVKGPYTELLDFSKLTRDISSGESEIITGAQLMSQITGFCQQRVHIKICYFRRRCFWVCKRN